MNRKEALRFKSPEAVTPRQPLSAVHTLGPWGLFRRGLTMNAEPLEIVQSESELLGIILEDLKPAIRETAPLVLAREFGGRLELILGPGGGFSERFRGETMRLTRKQVAEGWGLWRIARGMSEALEDAAPPMDAWHHIAWRNLESLRVVVQLLEGDLSRFVLNLNSHFLGKHKKYRALRKQTEKLLCLLPDSRREGAA